MWYQVIYGQILLIQGLEIFMMISENICAGLSAMTVADFFQLLSVKEKLVFSRFSVKISIKHLLGC